MQLIQHTRLIQDNFAFPITNSIKVVWALNSQCKEIAYASHTTTTTFVQTIMKKLMTALVETSLEANGNMKNTKCIFKLQCQYSIINE